jgi:hypothetical protein
VDQSHSSSTQVTLGSKTVDLPNTPVEVAPVA